jgi:hypothetical protein
MSVGMLHASAKNIANYEPSGIAVVEFRNIAIKRRVNSG